MRVKKFRGKVYGADLTSAEQTAMNMEIQKQLAEYTRKHSIEIDAIFLWLLHEELGFGKKKLRRLYDRLGPAIDEFIKRYQLDDSDKVWLCTYMLKQRGIDIEKWDKERRGDG